MDMHILFIHSSAAEYVGCFHLLAIMNNTAVNIHVHFCADMFLFLLGIYLEVWLG